jgi:hypothetical protein
MSSHGLPRLLQAGNLRLHRNEDKSAAVLKKTGERTSVSPEAWKINSNDVGK